MFSVFYSGSESFSDQSLKSFPITDWIPLHKSFSFSICIYIDKTVLSFFTIIHLILNKGVSATKIHLPMSHKLCWIANFYF